MVPHGMLKFNRARFRKFALWQGAAGAICGTVAAILAPALYLSDALIPSITPVLLA
jgi:hypothetical protein